jgi:hypothetical protein
MFNLLNDEVESAGHVATPSTHILRPSKGLMKLNNNLFLIIVNRCYDLSRQDDTNSPQLRMATGAEYRERRTRS